MMFTQLTVNVMAGKKFKSSATLPADGKGLMAMGAMNCRARGVNAAANPSVRVRRVDGQCGASCWGCCRVKSPPQTTSGVEGDMYILKGKGGDHQLMVSCYWRTGCQDHE